MKDRITQLFLQYLKSCNVSEKTLRYYKSDLALFTAWLVFKIKSLGADCENLQEALPFLTNKTAEEYKEFLIKNGNSVQTINRRLSTLRILSKFLLDTNLLSFNFAKNIKNISKAVMVPPLERAAAEFSNYLEAQKASFLTRKNYLADINQFLRFIEKQSKKDLQEITSKDIKRYLIIELASSPETTKDRKISSLKKFFSWAKEEKKTNINPVEDYLKDTAYLKPIEKSLSEITESSINRKVFGNYPSYEGLKARINAYLAGKPRLQKLVYHILYTRPKWYKAYHSLAISRYLNFAILVIFATGLGFGIYQQLFAKPQTPIAYPSQPVPPKRYLSFQGRLTNQYQTPITTPTNIVFKLYDAATGGNTLWNSAGVACSVDPDEDGIFSILLGTTSGEGYTCTGISPIDSSVFTENAEVWLGIKVGSDPEATPRIQIATVAYALNAETLQGYPIDATGSATKNTVLTMNSGGEVVLAEVGPKIKSVSGNFSVQGEAVTIQANGGEVAGDITLSPASDGTVSILASGTTNDSLYIQNAQITSGALIHGYYGGTSTTVDLLKLGAGATESTKFLVESSGDTFIASGADLFIGGIGLNDNSSTSSGASLIGLYDDNMTYISGNTNVQSAIKQLDTAIGSVSGSAGGWTDDGTIVRLTTSSDRVGIGTTSVNSNTKVGILGNLAIGSQTYSDAQAPTNGLIVEGNVGIGTTSPTAKLDVAGDILVNNGGSIDTRAAGTLTIGGTTQTGLTVGRSGATTSIVGSNITAGGIAYGASNTLTFTSAGTSGQPLLSGGSGAPTFGTLGLVYGGTNANLSGVAQGGLIYKGASALSGTGALTGILQGNGSSAPTAITGTANYVPRWSSSAPYLTSTSTIFDNGTNVGIGTTVPTKGKLNVLGAVAIGSTAYTQTSGAAPANGLIVEGNVGIGTTSPTAKLDVAGDILVNNGGSIDTRAAGTLIIGGTTQTGLTVGRSGATITINGSSVVINSLSGIIQGSSGTISAITGTANYVPRWSSSAPYLTSTSTIFDNGTNVGIGTTVPTKGKLNVLGAVAIGSTAYTETSGAAPTNGLIVEGNVGIGTTAPGYKLDINGALRLMPSSAPTGANGAIYYDSSLDKFRCYQNGSWTDCIGSGGGSTAWSSLTNPTANLSLSMSTYTTTFNWSTGTGTNNLFSLTTDASANGTGSLLNIQTGTSSTVNPLRVRAGSTEALFVNSSGNVGIGTTNPDRQLKIVTSGDTAPGFSVDGSSLTYNEIFELLGTLPTNPSTGRALTVGIATEAYSRGVFYNDGTLGIGPGSSTRDVFLRRSTTNTMMIDSNMSGGAANFVVTGNVGIGTASPSTFKLEVAGSVGPSANNTYDLGSSGRRWANIYGTNIYGNITPTGFTQGSVIFAGAGGTLSQNNANFFWDNTNLRLGIGTNTPSVSIDSTGSLRLTAGTFQIGNAANVAYNRIGTNATNRGLSAASDLLINGKLEVDQAFFPDSGIYGSGGSLVVNFPNNDAWFSDEVWVDGKIGIGTTAPVNKLSVIGGVNIGSTSYNVTAPTNGLIVEGNVGIGTTAPASKFHLMWSDAGATGQRFSDAAIFENNGNAFLQLIGSAAGEKSINFAKPTNGADGAIKYNYSSVPNGFSFWTNGNNFRMAIDQNGNVGIGTTGPATRLHVVGKTRIENNGANIQFVGSDLVYQEFYPQGVGAGRFAWIGFGGAGTEVLTIMNQRANRLDLGTNNAVRVSIDSSGNVGIGTTGPGAKLYVLQTGGPSGTNNALALSAGNSSNYFGNNQIVLGYSQSLNYAHAIKTRHNSGAATGNDIDFYIWRYGDASGTIGGQHVMTLEGTGNVGIGTAGPATRLHVVGQTRIENNAANIQFVGSDRVYQEFYPQGVGAGRFAWIGFGGAGTEVLTIMNQRANRLDLGTNNAVGVSINSSGNVGIGTASPKRKLHIVGGGMYAEHSTNSVVIALEVTGLNGASLATFNNTDAANYGYGSRIRFGGSGTNANVFGFVGRGDVVHMIIKDGNVGIGTTSASNKLVVGSDLTGASLVPANTIAIGAADTSSDAALQIGESSSAKGYLKWLGTQDYFGIGTSNSIYPLVLKADGGNVGIGTTAPAYRLEIPNIANASGQGRANAWVTYSDIRFKENITPITNALEKINNLQGVYFDWKQNGKRDIGFIAQEVEPVLPEVVSTDPSGIKSLDYSRLTALLVQGIKEQQLQTASQSARVALLEKDLNLAITGDLNIAQTQDGNYQVQNSQTGDIITRLSAFAETVIGKIRAGSISAYEITTNGFIAFQAQVDNLLVKTGLVSPSVQTAMISPLADEKNIVIKLGGETGSDPVQGKLSIQNQNGEEVASINSEGDATFSGTLKSENLAVENNATISGDLTANNINTGEIRAEKLVVDQIVSPSGYNSGVTLEQIEELLRQAQADQNLLGQAEDWYNATSSAQIKNLAAETATLKNLFVTQSLAASSLSLSQSISLGTDMVIQSQLIDNKLANSIDTLTAPLSIQSLALAPVEIMAGKIRIETNGDVYIAGNLYVAGRVESTGLTVKTAGTGSDPVRVEDEAGNLAAGISASGSAQFKELASDKIVIAGASVATDSATLQNGEINTNASAGSGILPAGQKEIAIVSPNIKSESLVYVTPTSDTKNYVLYVKAKEDGRMVVGFNRALDIDVYFNWWVIEAR